MKNQYKMIFSDIDGTLLNSSHQISQALREEILRLEREGVLFVLVSARMPEGMTTIQEMIGNHAPMVCYSGGLIRSAKGESLYSCLMELGQAVEIKKLLDRDFPAVCCNTYGYGSWVVDDDKNPWVRQEEQITGLKARKGDLRTCFQEMGGIHKFLLMGEPEEMIRVGDRLRRDYPGLTVAASTPNYLEVMNGKVSKSAGVQFLCEKHQITTEEAIAFGDGHNDMDMLRAVKNSYAMANAPEEVQKSAAHVTLDNDHEGLLTALLENFPQ